MHVASTFRRISAHALDELIGSIFWIPILVYIWKNSKDASEVLITWKWIGIVWASKMTYEILCIYILQALPAQHFFGLRIVSTHRPEEGLDLMQIFIRVFVAQFKYIFGPSIYFMALFHHERQHLGDIFAETQVKQYSDRTFQPKARYIIGSILVYSSLVTHLSNNIELISSGGISKEGISIETPSIDIHIEGL